MLAFLLPIHFLLVFGLLSHVAPHRSLREKFIIGSLLWSIHLVLLTELLSLAGRISFNVLLGYWLLTVLLLGMAWHRLGVQILMPIRKRAQEVWQATAVFEKGLLTFAGILLVGIAIIGAAAPPNTWDSMTYHLARVMHWMQNKSVAHYPSHIMRQHYLPPFAEYVLLHLQLLSGGDRFANFVQFCSLLGCLAGVSLITRLFGGGRKAQVMSVFLTMTLPMAVLQANSTQNDLVASFWVVSAVYFLTKVMTARSPAPSDHIWTALAVGLATFTKATTYLWLFPFCAAVVAWLAFRRKTAGRAARLALAISLGILCLNAPHFWRNHAVYGHMLGGTPAERAMYVNASHTPQGMISNLMRNTVLHLRTPFYYWNRAVRLTVQQWHDWMGITIHEPEITFYSSGNLPFHEYWNGMSEDTAGNLFHSLFFGCSLVILLSKAGHTEYKRMILHASLCGAGFLFFCLYLRWQEWHSQLHLPFFMLVMPVAAFVVSKWHDIKVGIVSAIMVFLAGCCLLFNLNKPLLHTEGANFSLFAGSRKQLYTSDATYSQAMRYIAAKNPSTELGLRLGIDDGEYLYWVCAPARKERIRFHHIQVNNPSGLVSSSCPNPEYVLSSQDSTAVIRLGRLTYKKDTSIGFCHIYRKH